METATPGVKSTADGWLNRYLHAREHEAATPFRAVALAPQLPRIAAGHEPALAIGQIGAVRHPRRRRRATSCRRRSRRSTRGRATACCNGTGREAFDAVKMLKAADPARYTAGERRRVPALARSARRCGRSRSSSKADVGLEIAFAESATGITT